MLKQELRPLIKPASVDFNEANHTYVHKKTGEFYTGCTTISDAWDKSFFLGPWYAKEMAEKLNSPESIKAIQDALSEETAAEYRHIIDEAKGAAKRKSEQAKTDGTLAHDWLEHCINAKLDPSLSLPPTPQNPAALNAINSFVVWAKGHDIQWLASEEVLSSDEHRIAGKLDALAIVDGIPSIVDFKTSGQLSASYVLQCAGYDLMLTEMGFKVRQYIILRVPKDGAPAETLTISDLDEMQFARETFLWQREAHKFYVYAENKLKENGKMKTDAVSTTSNAIEKPAKGQKSKQTNQQKHGLQKS